MLEYGIKVPIKYTKYMYNQLKYETHKVNSLDK
jgi:hypothetical protein